MNDNPLVSIIIPAYNAEEYLAETIASAKAQTWANIEIIIVDDGSTDNTLAVIEGFKNDIIFIRLLQNKGAAAARNAGLAAAKGKYIQFLDADDLLSTDKIESQLKVLDQSVTHLAFCKTVYFKNGAEHTQTPPLQSWHDKDFDNPADFLIKLYAGEDVMPGFGGMITIHAWLTPAKLIEEAGPWNEDLSVDDDGEFFSRVILASAGLCYSSEALCYYRKFDDGRSLSTQRTRKAIESSINAIDLKHAHLTSKAPADIVDRVFARHYWQAGLLAYPSLKLLSAKCVNKAKLFGYNRFEYSGGKFGMLIARLLGWKAARIFSALYQTNLRWIRLKIKQKSFL